MWVFVSPWDRDLWDFWFWQLFLLYKLPLTLSASLMGCKRSENLISALVKDLECFLGLSSPLISVIISYMYEYGTSIWGSWLSLSIAQTWTIQKLCQSWSFLLSCFKDKLVVHKCSCLHQHCFSFVTSFFLCHFWNISRHFEIMEMDIFLLKRVL